MGAFFQDGELKRNEAIRQHIVASAIAMQQLINDEGGWLVLAAAAHRILTTFSSGGRLLLCGNGGSAADAQHIAAEFIGRYRIDREGLPAIALTTDTSVLTAVGNDYGFSRVFQRQVEALGRSTDTLWAFSTSGQSQNVINAMKAAKARGMSVVGFTGESATSDFCKCCDELFAPKVPTTPLLQQLHMVGAHAICDAVDRELFRP